MLRISKKIWDYNHSPRKEPKSKKLQSDASTPETKIISTHFTKEPSASQSHHFNGTETLVIFELIIGGNYRNWVSAET